MPVELKEYDTIAGVFSMLLPVAMKEVRQLEFSVTEIDDFQYALWVVNRYTDKLNIDKRVALDKIFSSIGIRYNTVKRFFE